MLRVVVREVNPGHLEELRQWLGEVGGARRVEALATLADEDCSHEIALLLQGQTGAMVVHVMEVEEIERSARAARESQHPIDAQHKQVMSSALGGSIQAELLLDLRP
jgi:hypothetical protein